MFWELIDEARSRAKGNSEIQMALLREKLATLPIEQVVAFGHQFNALNDKAYTWPLWGAAYLIGGGCSDDGFSDFRGWLISQGREVFEAALKDPETLAPVARKYGCECQVEGFQYVGFQAWAAKTGKPISDFPKDETAYEPTPMGEEWSEDELPKLFPAICAVAVECGNWSAD